MSRLSASRIGIPSANQASKFRGFRRKHWMVCGLTRDAHFARLAAGLPTPPMLTRTWREGEPLYSGSPRQPNTSAFDAAVKRHRARERMAAASRRMNRA